jgi:hypothetical protein
MADIVRLRQSIVDRALKGDGRASAEQRRGAFDDEKAALPQSARPLVHKIVHHASKVTDEDIAATKTAGVTEDQLFELTICASLGQAMRQLDAAYKAIESAEKGLAASTEGVK